MPATRESRSCCSIFKKCCKLSFICVLLIVLVWLILAVAFPYGIDKEIYRANMTSKVEKAVTTDPNVKRIDHNAVIHQDRSISDFSSNTFSRLLTEYVKVMSVKDCYICAKLPTSVSEGVTYHMLPLTYGITCSVIASLFYETGHLEYYYSDFDVTFADLKVVNSLNKVKPAKHMREFFLVISELTYDYAFRNNLTCRLSDVEKMFLNQVEERRAMYKRDEVVKQTKTRFWQIEDQKLNGKHNNVAINIDKPISGKLCIRRDNTVYDNYFVGASHCEDTYRIIGGWGFKGGRDPIFPGVYFVCGDKAYYSLPDHWYGTCFVGIVFPKIYHVNRNKKGSFEFSNYHLKRFKRESFTEIMGDIFQAIIPMVGITLNANKIRKMSTIVDRLSTDTATGFQLVNTELIAMRTMLMQDRLALDMLLAKEGGVCGILHVQHCCTYIPDKSKDIDQYIRNITELHHEVDPLVDESFADHVAKRIAAIKHWFQTIGSSLIGKIVLPIIIIAIVILMIKVSCMIHKRRKHLIEKKRILKLKKEKEEEIELAEFRKVQYESCRKKNGVNV